ncbi:MAG TPA: hypothetical protein PLY34_06430 [Ferruginibacter sp.]|nr:hypothetical protein [Ferruginibacter sp.]
MYSSKLLLCVVMLVSFNISTAQQKVKNERLPRRKPSFVLHAGGGMSYYTAGISQTSVAIPGTLNKWSPAATLRLMWYPRYRLRLGIESGIANFYRYNVRDPDGEGKVTLQAVPVLVVWNMQVRPRWNIYAGFGSYFLTSWLDYRGKVRSTDVVLGSNVAVSYTQPINRRVSAAAEIKLMNAFETKDAALTLQLHFVWKVFQWD